MVYFGKKQGWRTKSCWRKTRTTNEVFRQNTPFTAGSTCHRQAMRLIQALITVNPLVLFHGISLSLTVWAAGGNPKKSFPKIRKGRFRPVFRQHVFSLAGWNSVPLHECTDYFPCGNNFRQRYACKSGRTALLLLLTLLPFALTFPLLFTLEALLLLLPGDRSHQFSSTKSQYYVLLSSLFIHAYSSRWVSMTLDDICACCFGRMHWHSLATMDR